MAKNFIVFLIVCIALMNVAALRKLDEENQTDEITPEVKAVAEVSPVEKEITAAEKEISAAELEISAAEKEMQEI